MTEKPRGAIHRAALAKAAGQSKADEIRRRAGEIAGRAADADALHHAVAWIREDKSLAYCEGELNRLREIRVAVAGAQRINPAIDPVLAERWFTEGLTPDAARDRLATMAPGTPSGRGAASWDHIIDSMRGESAGLEEAAKANGWGKTMDKLAAEMGRKPK